jgi:hypothetical protein
MSYDDKEEMPVLPDNFQSNELIVNGKHVVKVLYESNEEITPSVLYARYIGNHDVETLKATMDKMVEELNSLKTPTYVIVNFEGVDMVPNSLMNVKEHPVYAHPKVKTGLVYGMNIAVKFQNQMVAHSAVRSGEKQNPTPRYYDDIAHVISNLAKDYPEDLRNQILNQVNEIEDNLKNNKE